MQNEKNGGVKSDPFDCHLTIPLPDSDPVGGELNTVELLEEQVNGVFEDLKSLQTRIMMVHCQLQTQVVSSDLDEIRNKLDSIESKLIKFLISKVGFTYDEVEDGVSKLIYIGTGEQ